MEMNKQNMHKWFIMALEGAACGLMSLMMVFNSTVVANTVSPSLPVTQSDGVKALSIVKVKIKLLGKGC